MKKSLLMAVIMMMMAKLICAAQVSVGGINYVLSGSTASVTRGTYKGSISIPSSFSYGGKRYTVTSIGDGAFENSTELVSVSIPATVTSIGLIAFNYCTKLTSVVVPNSVTQMDRQVFGNCSSLKQVTLSDKLTEIPSHTFSSCTALTSLPITRSIKKIGNYAFSGCDGLTEIVVPETVESIGEYAFQQCASLTSVTLPSKLTSIANGLFYLSQKLEKVVLPPNITSIGDNAFCWCSRLQLSSLPKSLKSIGSRAFEFCTGLSDLELPESINEMGQSAFNSCFNLKISTLPSSLKEIKDRTFYYCSNQTNQIKLPDGIEHIGVEAFAKCYNTKSMQLPSHLKTIGAGAFSGCNLLTSLVLPHRVDSIGDKVFAQSGIKKLTLSSALRFGPNVFVDSSIEEIDCQLTDSSYICKENPVMPTNPVTYSRTSGNEWGTVVLPFSAEAESELYELYEPKEFVEEGLKVKRVYGYARPGTPLLVRMLPASKTDKGYELLIKSTDQQLWLDAKEETRVDGLTLKGSNYVADITGEQGYIISNNRFWNIQDVRGTSKVYCAPFHAYFSGTLPGLARQFSLSASDSSTAIREVSGPDGATYYHLSGRRTDSPQRGVNLVRSADGTVKKVLKY